MANSWNVLVGYDIGGRKGANTMIVYTSDLDDAAAELVANTVADEWEANVMPQLNDYVVMNEVRVTALDQTELFVKGTSVAGGVGTAGATPNVAYLVKCSLEGTTRSGRWFLPGVSEIAVDELGNVSTEYVDGITDACAAFIDELASGDFVVAKRSALGYKKVTGVAADTKISTMRRRLR